MTYNYRPYDDAQSYHRVINDFYPRLETEVFGFRVSSLYRYIAVNPASRAEPYLVNETCVFSPHDAGFLTDSLVIGTYHDHNKIVKAIEFLVSWCDESDKSRWGELGDFVIGLMPQDDEMLSFEESQDFLETLVEKGE